MDMVSVSMLTPCGNVSVQDPTEARPVRSRWKQHAPMDKTTMEVNITAEITSYL